MLRLIYSMRDLNFEKLSLLYGLDAPDKHYVCREFYDYLIDDFFTVPGALYAVWDIEEEYVSAFRAEPYLDGYLIEGLQTIPHFRNMGYAKSLLRSFISSDRTRTCFPIYAHIHKANVTSLKVHESCGFERILEYALYIDGSVYRHSCTVKFSGGNPHSDDVEF